MKTNVIIATTCLLSILFVPARSKGISGGSDAGIDYVYTHSWITKSSLPSPRSDFTATTVNDKIILTGGCIGRQTYQSWGGYGCNAVDKKTIIYHPKTDSFTTAPDMPRARYRHSAVAVGEKVYVMGGTNLDYPEPTLKPLDVFDTSKNKWITLTNVPLNGSKVDGSAFAIAKKIYFVGGYETSQYNATNKAWVLDTEKLSDGWKPATSLKTNRGDHCSVTIDGSAYVFGGFNHHDQWSKPLNSLEKYDSKTNKWISLSNVPTARGDKAGAVLNGRFQVIGGETKDSKGVSVPLSDVEVYNPILKKWTQEGDIPSKRFRFAASPHGDSVYIFGGQGYIVGVYGDAGSYYPTLDTVEAFHETKSVSAGATSTYQYGVVAICLFHIWVI